MRIVIVGGGFAGVKAAVELSKRGHKQITLISDQDYFLHHATLYATATGRSRKESVIPLAAIFKNHPAVTVVKDTVRDLDVDRKLVLGTAESYEYDELILALGVVTTYFGIPGLAERSYGIKTLSEVESFKQHLHRELDADEHKDKTYVVVGAGPTGVELAGALSTYITEVAKAHHVTKTRLRIMLVEAAPRILPRMSEAASLTVEKRLKELGIEVLVGAKVEAQNDEAVVINGAPVPTDSVVWTSGVTNHPFFKEHAHLFHLAPNGRVEVDEHLMAAASIYVIGDNANTKFTGTAYTALHNATYVAKHLTNQLHHRPTPGYAPFLFATTVPVGRGWAFYERAERRLAGSVAAWLRRLTELRDYLNLVPFSLAWRAWRAHHQREEECALCSKMN